MKLAVNCLMDQLVAEAQRRYAEVKEAAYELALRENAKPPIRGLITKSKIRWRGIYELCNVVEGDCWLMQRDRQISPTISMTIVTSKKEERCVKAPSLSTTHRTWPWSRSQKS